MAKYQILSWKALPSQVKAFDERGEAKEMLPQSFQDAIDRAAMKSGEYGTDAYLDGWTWSEPADLAGSAEEALREVVARLTRQ